MWAGVRVDGDEDYVRTLENAFRTNVNALDTQVHSISYVREIL